MPAAKLEFEWEKEWLAQVDDFRTFLGEFVSNLPQPAPGHELWSE